MTTRIEVLDHGYVSLVETWGSDEQIVEAARMSTGKGFKGWGGSYYAECSGCGFIYDNSREVSEWRANLACINGSKPDCNGSMQLKRRDVGDEKLLRYLYENKHATPFEMAGMIVEVQAPIFVFREWHRHRTQSYNEMSARYAPIPDVNYVPSIERLMMNAGGSNKQAGTIAGSKMLTRERAEMFRMLLHAQYEEAQDLYEEAMQDGVPKELARVIMPVGRYSRMRASANLRNWLAFLTLRMDEKAQYEIRQYAIAVRALLALHFPRTLALFDEEQAA